MRKSGLDETQSQESDPYQAHHPEPLQHTITRVPPSWHISQQLQQLDLDNFVIRVQEQIACIPIFDDAIKIFSA